MFTSLTDSDFCSRFMLASELASEAKSTQKVTPQLVQDALKFIDSMPDGSTLLGAAKSVACILPAQPTVTIWVGGVEFVLPRFYDRALAKDSPYFRSMLEPAFKDSRTFPELNIEVFKCFLARAYEGDMSTPEFEGYVECIRMVYEYEFEGYSSILLMDFISSLKLLSAQQIATCYALAHEIGENLLIDTLDCMQNSPAPNAYSRSCTVSHISQLTHLLETNPTIEFFEVRLDDFGIGIKNLIQILDQFKSLTHVLILDSTPTYWAYNPFKECKYKVSYFTEPVTIAHKSISVVDNFESGFIPKITFHYFMGYREFLCIGGKAQDEYKALIHVLNQYVLLILRGAVYYNLNVIPNKLFFNNRVERFFYQFAEFVDVSFETVKIKEGFNLDRFLKAVHSLPKKS